MITTTLTNRNDIATAITDNCFKKFSYFPNEIPSIDIKQLPDLTIINSLLPSNMFNIVYANANCKIKNYSLES